MPRSATPFNQSVRLAFSMLVAGLVLLPRNTNAEATPADGPPPAGHDFFRDEVWPKVLERKCLKCHKAGGDAEESEFVFHDPSRDSSQNKTESSLHNRQMFYTAARWRDPGDADWRVLLKPIDAIDHDGGEVLELESPQFRILRTYVRILNGETVRPTLPASGETKPFFDGVAMIDPMRLLRRLSLSLAGRLPTSEEIAAVEGMDAEESLDALDLLLDAIMEEDAFYDRLAEGFNDIFLTRGYDGLPERALSYEHFGSTRNWFQKHETNGGNEKERTTALRTLTEAYREAILREPMELVRYIVREERSFTEIVTADYLMVSPYSARGYGIFEIISDRFEDPEDPFEFIPVRLKALRNRKGEVCQESATGHYPHAGLLSTFQYLMRYPTTETNRNRLRSRMYYLHFLGIDVMELAPMVNDAAAITAKYEVPTMEASDCVVCHRTIDPLSGLFQDFYVVEGKGVYGPREEGWFEDMFRPGFEGDELPKKDRWRSLQWLGTITAKDPRFAVAMVEHVYYILTGRNALRAPEDAEDTFYEARWRAYREQRKEIETIAAVFVAEEFNLKTAFKGWARSKFYRADTLAAAESDPQRRAELAGIGRMRLLAPEQMERKIEALFGERYGKLESQFNVLYGGIDSKEITERILEPGGAMGAIQRLLANELSCRHVVPDFATAPRARRLFPEIEPDDLPGVSASQDRRIRMAIAHLHAYLLARPDPVDSPEVDRSFELFAGIVADAEARKGTEKIENYACGRIDGVRVDDPHYTLRAWRGVVTYLLRRPEFLYE